MSICINVLCGFLRKKRSCDRIFLRVIFVLQDYIYKILKITHPSQLLPQSEKSASYPLQIRCIFLALEAPEDEGYCHRAPYHV